ncbi:MAG: ion channel [Pseudomonadota bacterium]
MASERRYWGLFASQLAMLLLAPAVAGHDSVLVAAEFVFALLLVFAVWSVGHDRKTTSIAVAMASAVFTGSLMVRMAGAGVAVEIATLTLGCVFFAYVATIVLRDIFTSNTVTLNTIIGAICAYILFGVLWGFLYGVVDLLDPSAFPGISDSPARADRFVYFSMVTLTTLGYGDITPASGAARGLAIVEATIGQVYLTVLVARLVGLHLTHASSETAGNQATEQNR